MASIIFKKTAHDHLYFYVYTLPKTTKICFASDSLSCFNLKVNQSNAFSLIFAWNNVSSFNNNKKKQPKV